MILERDLGGYFNTCYVPVWAVTAKLPKLPNYPTRYFIIKFKLYVLETEKVQ